MDAFPWMNKSKGYKRQECKPCFAARARACRDKKLEQYRAKQREYHHANKEKRNAQRRANADPRRSKDARLRKQYGITIEQYDAMLEVQGGVCAICGEPETSRNQHGVRGLAVDHCHTHGNVRSLLCAACNLAIGHMREDRAYAEKLLAYVERRSVA